MASLNAALEGGRNSFNLVRLAAAGAVVVSHSFALRHGDIVGEPLSASTPYTLGQHAVNVFFVLSGVMVSRSWDLNPSLTRFALARGLRIYPGLLVCGLITALVLGALGTAAPLGAYFTDRDTLLYPLLVAVRFNQAGLDAVFTEGTKPGAVNASLWTIKYELAAYGLFAAAAALGLVRRRAAVLAALLVLAAAVIGLDLTGLGESRPGLEAPGRFFLSFALGLAAYAYRERVALRWDVLAGLATLAIASRGLAVQEPAFILFTGYGALVLGSRVMPNLSAWAGRTDLSYGLYLYAWPIQQLLLQHWPAMEVPAHIALSLTGSLACAALSWPLVERPALALKARVGAKQPGPGVSPAEPRHTVPGADILPVGSPRSPALGARVG